MSTCSATDGGGQRATCTFAISVIPPPRLTRTTFMTFGDSITEGILGLQPSALSPGLPVSYPFKLHAMLSDRYTGQVIDLENAGRGGERAVEGVPRLRGLLDRLRPEVVLLLEGVNDLAQFGSAALRPAADAVQTMARDARNARSVVLIGTLPPERPGGRKSCCIDLLAPYNDSMRRVAAEEGAVLVDIFEGFGGDFSLLGDDGLHPNQAGYERIAQIFFDAIKTNLELQASPLTFHRF